MIYMIINETFIRHSAIPSLEVKYMITETLVMLKPILIPFVMAIITSLLGYFSTTPPEQFNKGKFLSTIFIGILVGVLTAVLGWDYATATQWLASSGIIIWVYWFSNILTKAKTTT